jgi:hypothetical protein
VSNDKRKPEDDEQPETPPGTRMGGGGKPVAADDPRDTSVADEDAGNAAEHATPPTEGPAAAGALPG